MANFDTAAKRYSGLCLGDMLPVTPIPDGTVGVPDRLHFLDLYCGIAADAPVVIVGGTRNLPIPGINSGPYRHFVSLGLANAMHNVGGMPMEGG